MDLPEILFIILIIVMIFSYCGFHLALRFCGPKSRHHKDSKKLIDGMHANAIRIGRGAERLREMLRELREAQRDSERLRANQ